MIIAVDIGGTKLAASLVHNQQILESRRISTPKSGASGDLSHALEQLITPFLRQGKQVVVASTGIINQGRLTAVNPDNLGGLNDFPLQSVIEGISGLPVKLLNDAQAAAWGEFYQLESTCQNMAFITVSTGVGAGLVINSSLQTGSSGLAGHAGHTTIDIQGPVCGCGRTGCVEAIASGTAIGTLASERYGISMDAKAVFERFHQGEQDARFIIHRSASAIAQLISNLKALLDIEVAVLGGSVGLADGYLDLVQYYITQQPALFQVDTRLAQLGHDAGITGAALWASQ
ncbi:N-acetylmannosamine kinase [Endozoicomonas ascidiicola]|uniref:N-acetylmannosamine kinase n=1 Tax=Endozoicomonas ascidiicola TaxID=1698521 RepID=UPI0008327A60|nr:N-acetylmannosamine kinase [Endozoicomonas ascidiicola]